MISEIRTYIKDRISEVDPSLKEWTDVFNMENIPETIIDNAYHIKIGSMDIRRDDGVLNSEVDIEINLFKKGYRSPQDAHDELFDSSVLINLCLSDISKYNSTYVRDYNPEIIEPFFFSTNDNLIIIKVIGKITTMLKSY